MKRSSTFLSRPTRNPYLPGEEATIRLEAKDASGNGINGTALVSVVDEAVFAVVPQELDLAHELYLAKYFAYPTQTVSYQEYNLEANPDTGGGMGGGGGDGGALREHFPDTALFQTVELVGGSGEVTFTLPDNITSWRITAAAVDDTLRAGSQKELIISTKEFYLNALTSLEYLEGDDVTVSAIGVSSQHPGRRKWSIPPPSPVWGMTPPRPSPPPADGPPYGLPVRAAAGRAVQRGIFRLHPGRAAQPTR